MVSTPHPITFTINDENSNVQSGVRCYVSNTTKGTILETDENGVFIITDSNGNAIIDLANLPVKDSNNEYDQGDIIMLIAYDGKNSDGARYIVVDDSKSQTLQLNPIVHKSANEVTSTRIMSILAANTGGSGAFAKVYSVKGGELLAQLEVPSNDQRDHIFGGGQGKGAFGGFIVEREATTLVVTTTER